jgi:hypothetical protein
MRMNAMRISTKVREFVELTPKRKRRGTDGFGASLSDFRYPLSAIRYPLPYSVANSFSLRLTFEVRLSSSM